MRWLDRYERTSPRNETADAFAEIDELSGLEEEVNMAVYEAEEYEEDWFAIDNDDWEW